MEIHVYRRSASGCEYRSKRGSLAPAGELPKALPSALMDRETEMR